MIEMNELKKTESVTLEIQVTTETAQKIQTFIQEQGWEMQEGYRYMLGAGLGFLRGEVCLQDNTKSEIEETERKRFTSMICEAESHMAAIRYRLFEFQQANQAWELSTGAVYTDNRALRNLVCRQKEEISGTKKRIAGLEKLRSQEMKSPTPGSALPKPDFQGHGEKKSALKKWWERLRSR